MSPKAPRAPSSSQAGPSPRAPDAGLLAEVVELRKVVALGHQARSASGLKLRQPLRRLVVEGAPLAAGACRRDRRGAPRQGGRVRPRRCRAAGEAAPARARAEARQGARRRARRSPGRRASRSSEGVASGPPATSSARRRCSSSGRARTAGRSPATRASPSRSRPPSTTSWRARVGSTSSSTGSTRCARTPGSS